MRDAYFRFAPLNRVVSKVTEGRLVSKFPCPLKASKMTVVGKLSLDQNNNKNSLRVERDDDCCIKSVILFLCVT